ncbi:MAG TPA: hypothetical protein VFO25_11775 [Candidatus Eremiobacteraceae bacterium]|nr:hypothetical protein [Candidatus Eremiobacteraceae bacterium]
MKVAPTPRTDPALSVDSVRLVIMRPPLPITDAVVTVLTNRLISKFQTVTKGDEDEWYFNTANGSASVILTPDRIQFATNAPMDPEIILATIVFPIDLVLGGLEFKPPYPYGIYFAGSFDAAPGTSLEAIDAKSDVFKALTPDGSTHLGGGFRNVYVESGQTFDCKVETLFLNSKKFFVSVDANCLATPADNALGLVEDLRRKFDLFTKKFAPLVSHLMVRA